MARFRAPITAVGQADFISSTAQLHALGARTETDDGRVYRYVLAGEALVAGNCLQSPAIVVNHLANTAPAVAIGAMSFTYTPGNTAGNANQYADGYLQVDTTPGNGVGPYGVSGHAAITSGTAFTLNLKEPIQVALTSSSRIGLIANPYRGVIQMPATTATGTLVGVATYVIASGEYGWIQTWGIGSPLISGTPALGAMVVSPSGTAGAAAVIDTTELVTKQTVGFMAQIGVSGKNNACFLRIAA